MNCVENSQFTWIFVGNRSHAYKNGPLTANTFWKTATVSCEHRDGCTTRFWCTLMVAVKQVYTAILRDRWNNLRTVCSFKPPRKRLGSALALYTSSYDRKCKSAMVSKQSAGPLWARGPIRRNRSNRFKTGPARMSTLC